MAGELVRLNHHASSAARSCRPKPSYATHHNCCALHLTSTHVRRFLQCHLGPARGMQTERRTQRVVFPSHRGRLVRPVLDLGDLISGRLEGVEACNRWVPMSNQWALWQSVTRKSWERICFQGTTYCNSLTSVFSGHVGIGARRSVEVMSVS